MYKEPELRLTCTGDSLIEKLRQATHSNTLITSHDHSKTMSDQLTLEMSKLRLLGPTEAIRIAVRTLTSASE